MLYVLIAISIGLPWLGVKAMENGGMSPLLDEAYGYPNGAASAYLLHLLYFSLGLAAAHGIWAMLPKRRVTTEATPEGVLPDGRRRVFLFVTAGIFLLITLLALANGGWAVLSRDASKVDLRGARDSLGLLGTALTLSLKWFMPGVFGACAFFKLDHKHGVVEYCLLACCALCMIVYGLSTGFKTTVLFVFQPYLVLRLWRVSVLQLAGMLGGGILMIISLAYYFDGSDDWSAVKEGLVERVTSYQGDLAWSVWGKANDQVEMPHYWKTYLSIGGTRFLKSAFDVDKEKDFREFCSYYFGFEATLFGGYSLEGVKAGVNNQATLFGEAVIALGPRRYPLFSFVAGLVFGGFVVLLRCALFKRQVVGASVWATFVCTSGLMWLMGNGAASLFYSINLIGLLVTGIYLYLFFGRRTRA